jgi:hypothetical protein
LPEGELHFDRVKEWRSLSYFDHSMYALENENNLQFGIIEDELSIEGPSYVKMLDMVYSRKKLRKERNTKTKNRNS